MSRRCLYCYKPLDDQSEFHRKCSMQMFGTHLPPELDLTHNKMEELARKIVVASIAVTGVQPKVSLAIKKNEADPKRARFTIVGLWGDYILKLPVSRFPYMAENEDLTMHLGGIFGLSTAQHSLIRLASGELAYITRRFDRVGGRKLAMEDMCQLTETLTEDKYRGSMERVGKMIFKYSIQPGLDALAFFETALFCFLTGNSDMHLKNFSLLERSDGEMTLAPAYDLLCTKILMKDDKEEIALMLNARKNKIVRRDFDSLAQRLGIMDKVRDATYQKFEGKISQALNWINESFLPDEQRKEYTEIMIEYASRLKLL